MKIFDNSKIIILDKFIQDFNTKETKIKPIDSFIISYLYWIRAKHLTTHEINISEFARKFSVPKNTIKNSLQRLIDAKIITYKPGINSAKIIFSDKIINYFKDNFKKKGDNFRNQLKDSDEFVTSIFFNLIPEYGIIETFVLSYIKKMSSKKGYCYKSKTNMSTQFGMTRRGFQKLIDRMIESGLIVDNSEKTETSVKLQLTTDVSLKFIESVTLYEEFKQELQDSIKQDEIKAAQIEPSKAPENKVYKEDKKTTVYPVTFFDVEGSQKVHGGGSKSSRPRGQKVHG